MRFKNIILLLSCLIAICACVPKPSHHSGVKLNPAKYEHTLELLNFIQLYSDLKPAAQKTVFLEVKQALASNKNHLANRIKLAAMLSLPTSRMRDAATAQHKLQALLAEDLLNISDSNLVSLLYTFTLNNNKQQQKLLSSMKKNEPLKLQNKALKQKLDDLKNIEKVMIERNTKTSSEIKDQP